MEEATAKCKSYYITYSRHYKLKKGETYVESRTFPAKTEALTDVLAFTEQILEKYQLQAPEFLDERGNFIVKFYKKVKLVEQELESNEEIDNLLLFCKTPRTRKEICDYLGLSSVTYAIQTHITPLVEVGKIKLSIPDKPKSPKQLYYSE